LYATTFPFKHVEMEMEAVEEMKFSEGGDLFREILDAEQNDGKRLVAENNGALAFVPFFARWPYEVWIFPKKRHATLATMSDDELGDLCAVFQQVTRRYDLLYDMVFPYVMSLYQAPLKGGPFPDYHLHFVLLPPLRHPGIQKFPAGPEIGGGNFMVDAMPEEKAAELRAVDLSRFKEVQ
jgi:UDPglucose--hexose-1-phosphate uridylyltransferase